MRDDRSSAQPNGRSAQGAEGRIRCGVPGCDAPDPRWSSPDRRARRLAGVVEGTLDRPTTSGPDVEPPPTRADEAVRQDPVERVALPDYEQGALDRLESGDNPLGWYPEGRREGVAIIRADLTYPPMPGHVRVCRQALTVDGMVPLDSEIIEVATGRRVAAVRSPKRKAPAPPPASAPETFTEVSGKHIDLRCPSDGALLVRDKGWYRCPTPKCKVVV